MSLLTYLTKPSWAFPILALVAIVLHCIDRLFIKPHFSPLKHLPSPKQGPLLFRLIHEPKVSEIETWMDTLPHQGLIRYMGVFNQERIFVASPEAAQELLSSNAYKTIKPELQWILANNIAGHGLLIQEGDQHKQARKRFNPVFSPAQMKKWLPTIWNLAVDAVDLLPQHITREQFSPHGVVGIIELVSAASIDIIGRFGFSTEFQTLQRVTSGQSTKDSPDPKVRFGKAYIEMFKTTKRGQTTLRAASLIGPQIALKLPLRAVKTIDGIMALVRATAEDITTDHERNMEKYVGSPDPDMLTLLIQTGHFSHRDLVEQTVHFFAAATETVAGSTCWAIHLLSRHPDIQERLRAEIREHVASLRSDVSQSQLHSLKYLNAVANEVLRYHSINTLLWREPTQDITLAGERIPKGTKIVFSPWALNRDPAHWGPDARVFNPSRWLDNPSGGADHAYSFLTFGGGPRRCVGEQYARDQLSCFVASLVGRYKFTPIDLQNGSDEGREIGDDFALTLFKILSGWKLNVELVPGW
ncbi:uncharacterized protein FPRO_11187 [Fusarium proliferatum ET1]|uniref:Related to pisatin demethylase / cytochrome P450 monooxygenase n=1 Tax=Fusarium proliferatum (strain ET1) TaxID=1227346 RepID=A0A1L7VM48_FUSPR|nr:uncharacterized protein FPRO_11187 [Fusarium proliferatum ET1]CZR41598.1 related to pisatin demethylase / cytochrome P450 monooxygenase [Fusarium proliferatum ET1]